MTKLNKKDFDYVVFDFDGVIVDSVSIKTSVFEKTLMSYTPANVAKFMTYHKFNGGVSRWAKFDYFLREIEKRPVESIAHETDLLVKNFSEILANALNDITLTPGAIETLKCLKELGKPCYIVSGGAEVEVRQLVEKFGINSYFNYVLGSPKNKIENLSFLKEKGVLSGQGIFIGDAITDLESATSFGMKFIFMSDYSEWKEASESKKLFYAQVKNLNEIVQILKNDNEVI